MIKLLSNTWMTAPIGAVVYLVATVLFWQTPLLPPRPKADSGPYFLGPSWDFRNPEADQLISELNIEKKSLQQREQQLDDLATRLQAERDELAQAAQAVRQLQNDFDKAVLRVGTDEAANLKRLAKVYAAMDPETAASVLAELDNTAIVKIMLYVKDSEAAGILQALAKKGPAEARRTAEISEQLRLSSRTTATK
jgi:flagellar motility protein MotE (MotC chaperone)